MNISITVTVEVEHTTGQFVGRESLVEELISTIEGADPGSFQVDDSEYDVTSWEVNETAAQSPKAG